MEIAEQMTEKADMRRAMIFLQKYGISLNLGAKIYQKYGRAVYGVLQENPYRLAEDISGVGFRIADEIASDRDPYRFRLQDKKRNVVYSPTGFRRRPYLSPEGGTFSGHPDFWE